MGQPDLAECCEANTAQVGVDPKTAARWARHGSIPQTRHRAKVAAVLGRDVLDLWPDALKRHEPVWFRRWADIEREAVALRGFELAWVPGLLQMEAYARATLALAAPSPEEVDELVAARMQRQAVLHRPQPPLVVAVIDEAALRRRAGRDGKLMREQCEHIAACAELPCVQVHVVPLDTPIYLGMGGPFVLAELPDGARLAHQDGPARAHITDDAADIASLERRWARIVGEALPRAQSLDLIRRVAATWT
ncbi:DUF5753 domain-containing protein [Micromonospora sp. WMMD714]|uniref:DUF5753 domain-containing protein n=1 Tax=Micromonospora sp. WMMD714 TaxID=3016097 RepID=UPI00249AF65E|nr:DUF5753 domain-containing protein [Micromonospora sp. WMMD714]WFE64976.1 DUF5753 domain-containing protein [Micromonospora sp. WMMD714]